VKDGRDAADREMSLSKAALDREKQFALAMVETRARQLAGDSGDCSICGDYCALRLMKGITQNTYLKE